MNKNIINYNYFVDSQSLHESQPTELQQTLNQDFASTTITTPPTLPYNQD